MSLTFVIVTTLLGVSCSELAHIWNETMAPIDCQG